MNLGRECRRLAVCLLLPVALIAVVSCSAKQSLEPRAWIDGPPDGITVPMGTPVEVFSHGYARQGVTELLLSVDGQAYRRDAPAEAGMLGKVRQEWIPSAPGTYTLQVVAIDTTGAASSPAAITVRVSGEIAALPTPEQTVALPPSVTAEPVTEMPTIPATPIPTATIPPTPTPTGTIPPSVTPVDTATPSATPTVGPTATPTATPSPSPTPDIRFWADDTTLAAGSCTTVHWHVSGVVAYWVDGQPGVGDNGSAQTCPCVPETHTLTVTRGDGTQQNLVVTIDVTGTCVSAPPVPQPYVPADGLEVDCLPSLTLVWLPVSHALPVHYYVKLEAETSGKWTAEKGWGPVTGKMVTATVVCGRDYRWTVRAEDKEGNISDWSEWSLFTVKEAELY